MSMKKLLGIGIKGKRIKAIRGLLSLVIMSLILGLTGCSSTTGYTKARPFWNGTNYGYKDKKISDDEYSIAVTGRPTETQRVAEIAVLRAAYITKEAGKTHFIIIKQKTETLENVQLTALPMIGTSFLWIPVEEITSKEPTAILLIRLLPIDQPYPAEALNADEVIEHLIKHFE